MIISVNVPQRIALTDEGQTVELESLFDEFGDETDDTDIAVAAAGPLPDGRWFSLDLRLFVPATVN